jgi:hypothetical protein
MRMLKFFLAAAIPFALLGCPDKASPDPAAAKAGASATPAAKAAGSAGTAAPAASAKSGGW